MKSRSAKTNSSVFPNHGKMAWSLWHRIFVCKDLVLDRNHRRLLLKKRSELSPNNKNQITRWSAFHAAVPVLTRNIQPWRVCCLTISRGCHYLQKATEEGHKPISASCSDACMQTTEACLTACLNTLKDTLDVLARMWRSWNPCNCWWGHKMVPPLWKAVWKFLQS